LIGAINLQEVIAEAMRKLTNL